LKVSNVPTRYPNLPRDFEFAGYGPSVLVGADCRWGSMSYLELMDEDILAAQKEIDTPHVKLEQWVVSYEYETDDSLPQLLPVMMFWVAVYPR